MLAQNCLDADVMRLAMEICTSVLADVSIDVAVTLSVSLGSLTQLVELRKVHTTYKILLKFLCIIYCKVKPVKKGKLNALRKRKH